MGKLPEHVAAEFGSRSSAPVRVNTMAYFAPDTAKHVEGKTMAVLKLMVRMRPLPLLQPEVQKVLSLV